jgi:hypothetical protein
MRAPAVIASSARPATITTIAMNTPSSTPATSASAPSSAMRDATS